MLTPLYYSMHKHASKIMIDHSTKCLEKRKKRQRRAECNVNGFDVFNFYTTLSIHIPTRILYNSKCTISIRTKLIRETAQFPGAFSMTTLYPLPILRKKNLRVTEHARHVKEDGPDIL